jgi:hypothetical protein
VVGALGTLIGAGDGFLLTPVLLLVYPHDSARTISAISLAVVFDERGLGNPAYARQGRVDWRSGARFAVAALPGAILGALAVGLVPRRVFDALMGGLLGCLWSIREEFPAGESGASQVQRLAPGARVVKALNHIWAVTAQRGFGELRPAVFVCGDDPSARNVALGLAAEIGYDPPRRRRPRPGALAGSAHAARRRPRGSDLALVIYRVAKSETRMSA